MTTASRVAHANARVWFSGLGFAGLLACGNLTSSPRVPPDTSQGGESNTLQAGAASGAGAPSAAGGTSGGVTLVMTTAGTSSSSTPLHPGTAGEGGQPDYPAVANLCIYPEDIPENWAAGGAAELNGPDCVVGVLGEFNYMGCRYDLLSVTAFDVDVFLGGHSHCCYAAKLLDCK